MPTVDSASSQQIEIGRKLGLDLSKDTWNVARARILDIVGPAIGDIPKYSKPTAKQIRYAKALGIDISNDTFRVGSGKIDDVLLQHNLEALERLQLKPGDEVVRTRTVEINGETHTWEEIFVVSSIKPDGLVYFKGGGGKCAFASQLRKRVRAPNSSAAG